MALLGISLLGWGTFNALGNSPEVSVSVSGPSASAADQRQEEILRSAIHQAPDPALGRTYDEINMRHFSGLLPAIPVVWEPRLAEVGPLAARAFTLEGMYGRIREEAVILLNPVLSRDDAALRRALCHEMVHAYLHAVGDSSADHGPLFQATLKRLSDEGAFPGIVASDRERESLRGWLDQESARLDAENEDVRREGMGLAIEAREIEEALVRLNARTAEVGAARDDDAAWTRRRDAYNSRAQELGDRTARSRREFAAFSAQVERYNLMLSYPEGRDEQEMVAKRP